MNPGRLLLLLATSLPAILVDEGVVRPFVAPAVRGAGRSWRRSFVAPLVRLPSTRAGCR